MGSFGRFVWCESIVHGYGICARTRRGPWGPSADRDVNALNARPRAGRHVVRRVDRASPGVPTVRDDHGSTTVSPQARTFIAFTPSVCAQLCVTARIGKPNTTGR